MHARVNYRQVPPGRMDEVIRIYRDRTAPEVRGRKGFKEALVLTNRSTGKLIAISFWETEADMRASSATTYADAITGPVTREQYELSLRARPSPSRRTTASRRVR